MELKEKIGIHNRFDIEVIDAKTGKVKQTARGYNIICDQLWSCLLNRSLGRRFFGAIFYGSGSGTPSASDTSLFNHVAAVELANDDFENCVYSADNAAGVMSVRRSIQLSETTAVGVTITEVGIGYGTGSGNLCTHAMLQDMNGNPISITKTDTDIINIYATVFAHWSQIGVFHYFSYWYSQYTHTHGIAGWILGVKAPVDGMPQDACYAKEGPAVTNENGKDIIPYYNGSYYFNRATSWSYNLSDKTITATFARLRISDCNVGGIGTIWFGNGDGDHASMRLHVSDFYSGDNIQSEAVGTGDGTTKKFALQFDYPENAEVFVNGVKQTSGVTVSRKISGKVSAGGYCARLLDGSTDALNLIDSKEIGPNDFDEYPLRLRTYKGIIFRNFANDIGFSKISRVGTNCKVYGSNDLETWTLIKEWTDDWADYICDATTGHYKYYKSTNTNNNEGAEFTFNAMDNKSIEFATAPAQGDVITCSYHTPYIAKDSDHVFDFSYTIQVGEYTE